MSTFDDLKASLEEAVKINEGSLEGKCARHNVIDVVAIRARLQVSQADFANAIGVSLETIQHWENARRTPTGMAAKVLATIQKRPEFYRELESH
ncbi:NadS family protein [Larsenimonas salina]|uniref:NadS family protein n=1 Tax=Larsenimonas salina TaxID=1295565 RepID=UPI002072B1D5|nr:NadS family protein [Larsenimonas salina]MCM5705823.1 helix-turn-helix domain-containing protein [Larsenimonas salina]